MIENVKNNQIQGLAAQFLSKRQEAAKTAGSCETKVDFDALIDKAKQAENTDANAVEKARELLMSGQLDSPANIREAAESMIKYGI